MLEKIVSSPVVACDTETTGLNAHGSPVRRGHYPDRPFAFSFTNYEGENEYVRFPVDPFTRRVRYEDNLSAFYALKEFYENPAIIKVFHNAMFDLIMLRYAGIE